MSVVIHCFGQPGTERIGDGIGPTVIHDVPLDEASAELLNGIVADAVESVVVLASGGAACSAVRDEALAAFSASDEPVGLCPGIESGDLQWTWQTLPRGLRALAVPVEQRAAVFIRTTAIGSQLRFNAVDAPLWDLLIRADQTPASVRLLTGPTTAANTVPPSPVVCPRDTSLPELAPRRPGRSRRWLLDHLQAAPVEQCCPGISSVSATAMRAGLLQLHDYLDESHSHSQSIEGEGRPRDGDYWHGIMHRREPDYGNSKYWFRRVGPHPCMDQLPGLATMIFDAAEQQADRHNIAALRAAAESLGLPGRWDAPAFVDLCQKAASSGSLLELAARRIQWAEMLTLLAHCSTRHADVE